jgi:glutamyl-tRNA synthetase
LLGKSQSHLESSLRPGANFEILESLEEWTNEKLYESISGYARANGFRTGAVMWPIRIALSGQEVTPGGATELADILGKEETLNRIAAAVVYLKKVSGL